MTKYGMRFDTVKYWQEQAISLWRMRGDIPFVAMSNRMHRDIAMMPARELGHLAIMLAYYDCVAVEAFEV